MNSLFDLYNEILLDKNKWDYYGNSWYQPSDIINLFSNGESFIKSYLENGQKLSERTSFQIDELSSSNRIKHTLSIYLLGILFYDKCLTIRRSVEKQLTQSERWITHEGEMTPFTYYWFLICFFHDLGYCLETKKIADALDDLIIYQEGKLSAILPTNYRSNLGIPSIIRDNIHKYFKYRYMERNCIDHGIIGAKLFFDERFDHYELKKKKYGMRNFIENKRYWSNTILQNIHLPVAWTIAAHNVWFDNGNTEYTSKYRDYGLDGLIIKKPIISITKHPLLSLLSIVDSIDPIKFFLRENTEITIEKIHKEYKIEFLENGFRINVMGIDTDIGDRYYNQIRKIDEWITCNVDDNTGMFYFDM